METIDIARDIRSFLVDEFFFGRAEELQDDAPLLGTVIDSGAVLVLVTHLEDHFGITVADEDVVPDNLQTVKHLVALVARKLESTR